MLKREFKINLKSFIIWTVTLVGILCTAFLVYPAMKIDQAMMDQLLKSFPPKMLEAFSMDLVSIGSVSGWFATEGYMMVTLIGACFAALMGGTILLKEESDKTIEYLYSKPVKRSAIINSKVITGITYITALNIIVSASTYINFAIADDLNFKRWVLMSVAPLLLHYLFFFLSMFISTFFNKLKKMMGISLGLVLGTYFISMIAIMSDKISFLKYLSPFEYFSSRYIIINEGFNTLYLVLTLVILVASITGIYLNYNKKELTV